MKIKNFIFGILASLLLAGCASTTQNESVDLKLVDKYHGEYEVGFPIDVENFFYYSDRSKVTTDVSYNKNGVNVTEEVFGNTFYPRYSGEYLFSCSSATKSINKRINVVDSKPTLSVRDYACFIETGKEIYFVEIYSEIAPTYTPSTAELEVYNVQYASYNFDIAGSMTGPLTDYDYSNIGFTPKLPGLYRVCIRVVNGSKSVDGVINVVAANNKSDGNDNVYKMPDGTYASNKVVTSKEKDDVFILPASVYAEASYVVLDQLYKPNDSIGIRFKGKNIPSIGLMASPSLSGSFGINAIYGYVLSFERQYTNRYTVRVPMNGVTMKDGQASRDELFGVDDLQEGKYYYLTASLNGNNLQSNGKYNHSVHWSIVEIIDYGTINEHYSKPLKQIDSSGGWTDNYDVPSGRMVLYSSENRDIIFQIDGLPDQGDIVQFGGKKREGVNNYTFETTTTTSNKTTGNKAVVNGFIAFKGNYTAGDAITFAFKGYNIPGVALFCDTISGLTGGGKGLYICPGNGDTNLNKRLTFYGPYRLDSGNPEGYCSYDGVTTYENIGWNYRVYNDLNSPFAYDNLTDYGDYLYQIKIIKAAENEIVITAMLYDKQNGPYELVAQRSYYIWGYDGPISGSIIAYPGYLTMAKETTFSSYPVNTSPLDDEEYFKYRSDFQVDNGVTTVDIEKPFYPENDSNCLRDISYLGVKDACGIGKTIKMNFTGKNIPNVCLFADSVNGQAVGGGRGIYLCTSFLQTSDSPSLGAMQNQHKLMPYAPYRWAAQNPDYDDLTKTRYNDLGNATYNKGYGYLDAEDDVNYQYIIEIISCSSGHAVLTTSIINVDLSTTLHTQTIDLDLNSHMSLNEKVGLGTNLIFYGQGADITFTYVIE